MKKKTKNTTIILVIILLLLGIGAYRIFYGPIVSFKERRTVKNLVENYLTQTYGDHKFKVTGVSYEYDMETILDYSNPVGYMVNFKSNVVKSSIVTIDGLEPEKMKIRSDLFLENYFWPDNSGNEIYKLKEKNRPKEEIDKMFIEDIENLLGEDIKNFNSGYIKLNLPSNYGKIPTFEELKTNPKLYVIPSFRFNIENKVENKKEYEDKLIDFMKNKYNLEVNITFEENGTINVSTIY